MRPKNDVVDHRAGDAVIARLRAAASERRPPRPRTGLLLDMTGPASLLEVVAPERSERRHARRRIDHGLDGTEYEMFGKVVRRILAEPRTPPPPGRRPAGGGRREQPGPWHVRLRRCRGGAATSGSRYITLASGTAARTDVSTRLRASATWANPRLGVELQLGPHQQLVGPEVLGAHVDQPADARDRPRWRRGSCRPWPGVAPSPMSRPFISIIRMTAITARRTPMASVPTASNRALPVTSASPTPDQGQHQADLGADVLQQHDRQLGDLAPGG